MKIPKKGVLSECSNWCGITLLSTPSKILAKVIMKHLSLAVDLKLHEEQAGFRRGRGGINHIFTLRNTCINYAGVRQGCVMSTLLFNLVVDWIVWCTTEDQISPGIRWTPFSYLEDLAYGDDLALLSHTHKHIQEKTQRLNTFANQAKRPKLRH